MQIGSSMREQKESVSMIYLLGKKFVDRGEGDGIISIRGWEMDCGCL